jgi:hypothetical protein
MNQNEGLKKLEQALKLLKDPDVLVLLDDIEREKQARVDALMAAARKRAEEVGTWDCGCPLKNHNHA